MRILLLGSTGRTGKHLLSVALENEFNVSCLARNVQRIKPHNLVKLYEGDPSNVADLEEAIKDCDYVISALNISRRSDFPWSGLRTPKDYLSKVSGNIVSVAGDMGVKRVVICSAWGVAETSVQIPFWFKWLISNSNIGVAYRDHERQENIITNSALDWTIVRPVGLTNSNKEQKIKETFDILPQPSLTISRKAVASYMIDSLTDVKLANTKVVISKA